MKRFGLCGLLLAALLTVPVGAQSLDELLEQARAERARLAEEDRARIDAFRADAASQRQRLADITREIDEARALGESLSARFDENEVAIADARAALDEELGDLRELFGIVRAQAADARAVMEGSLVSAEIRGRRALLDRLSSAERLPSIDDLDALRTLMLGEMRAQGTVSRFDTEVFDASGMPATADVVRVGAFTLISGDRFLRYDAAGDQVREFGRQPPARFRADATALSSAPPGGSVRMAIDPTYGALLDAIGREPRPAERIAQAGLVGVVILVLGAVGLLLALWRALALTLSGRAMAAQARRESPDGGNPLGRILTVYGEHRDADPAALELKLDEAILRETPRLESWQSAIKIIAAVAPLLGLLGTVIGMIETFQQITLFGTGDPRLMADGISKALVTTMLGLIVAIPLVLLHAFVSARSRAQIDILEEQSAGMIARRAEAAP